MYLASAFTGSIPVAILTFIVLIAAIAFTRYFSVLLTTRGQKETTMNTFVRHAMLQTSCLLETIWAGMVSIVVGAMTGGGQEILALAKYISLI
ncbi:hypothetical protein I5P64_05970 [Serratia ureilytica]|nr:hypothetical protein [Serratia ureilytica]MBH3155835.1 hypothetical protein [Serratia ureilytica]MBH3250925.1 hypothetical protein [Serratia ureilytica]MBH3318170.1 hypothetical protein [Serratia ureilytica]